MKGSSSRGARSPDRPPVADDRRIEFWVAATAVAAVAAYFPLAMGAVPRFYAPSPVSWSLDESNCLPAGHQAPISEVLVPLGAKVDVSWSSVGGTKVDYQVFQKGNEFVPNPPRYGQLGFSGTLSFVSNGLVYAFQPVPTPPSNHICETEQVATVVTYTPAL